MTIQNITGKQTAYYQDKRQLIRITNRLAEQKAHWQDKK